MINVSTQKITLGEPVIFTAPDLGYPCLSYTWNFGSNATPSTATGLGPVSVVYSSAGTASVSLTVDNNCENTPPNPPIVFGCCNQDERGEHDHPHKLILEYVGGGTTSVSFTDGNNFTFFNGQVSNGDIFTVDGTGHTDKHGEANRLGTDTYFRIGGGSLSKVHTSCSQDISPGFGITSNGDLLQSGTSFNSAFIIRGIVMLNTGSGSSIYCEEGITDPAGGGSSGGGSMICGSDCFDCIATTSIDVTIDDKFICECSNLCIERVASNTILCPSGSYYGTRYGGWLLLENLEYHYEIKNGKFQEFHDGTARLTEIWENIRDRDIRFEVDVLFTGRTTIAPNQPKEHSCLVSQTNTFYYYTTTSGYLTGIDKARGALLELGRMGPAFQVGIGANITNRDLNFGASGWLTVRVLKQPNTGLYLAVLTSSAGGNGDININLDGDPRPCIEVTVTVDEEPPVFDNFPEDVTVECDNIPGPPNDIAASDNCDEAVGIVYNGEVANPITGECPQHYTITRSWTATDDCDNSLTREQIITVVDNTPLVITPPTNDTLTVECDGNNNINELNAWLNNNGGATATDNCGQVTWTNTFDIDDLITECGGEKWGFAEFQATDDCGNQSIHTGIFRILDRTAPEITTPARDTMVECDGNGNIDDLNNWIANNGGARGMDICSPYEWQADLVNEVNGCAGTGSKTYNFKIIDECGNEKNTNATFIIQDTRPPEVTCEPRDTILECVADNEAVARIWNNNNIRLLENCATDICGTITVSSDFDYQAISDLCAATGSFEVTYVIKDECGLVIQRKARFTVKDETPPAAICQDITVQLESDGTVSISPEQIDNGSNDICRPVTFVSVEPNSFDLSHCGTTVEVTLTVEDECGNRSTCTANVKVECFDLALKKVLGPGEDTLAVSVLLWSDRYFMSGLFHIARNDGYAL